MISDLGGNVDIPVSGIKISLMDKDGGLNPDDELGVTWTDDNGNFTFSINECQKETGCLFGANCEGNALELYLKIESSTAGKTINVRQRYGGTRDVTFRKSNVWHWDHNDGEPSTLNMGNVRPSKSIKPQLLHWANVSRNFVNGPNGLQSEGIVLAPNKQKQLDIMIHPMGPNLGGVFIPGYNQNLVYNYLRFRISNTLAGPSVLTRNQISNDDCVYIGKASENNEDLLFHEFGHYLMWHLQNKSWQNPLEASFASHSEIFNCKNPAIAWNEGWATGFGSIIDNFARNDDNEAGQYSYRHFVELGVFDIKYFRNQSWNVKRGSNIAKENTVTHGFVSEGNVGSVIYDLYDGVGKVGRYENVLTTKDIVESHSDNGNDNVSLTFAQICKPLLNNQGQGFNSQLVIKNITDYAFELAEIVPCHQKRLIKDIFDFNDIRSFDNPPTETISTDRVAEIISITNATFKWKSNIQAAKFKGDETFDYSIDVPVIDASRSNFNLKFRTGETNAHVSDNLTVTEGRIFGFNTNTAGDWANAGTPNPPSGSRLGGFVSSTFTLNDGGAIEVGTFDASTFADVSFCSGSQLILRNDAVSSPASRLVIHNNSSLTIEQGAILEYHPNTQIILNGPNAQLIIKGEIRLMNDAVFSVQGGAQGLGKVIFHKDWQNSNLNIPRLINGNGSVALNGSGKTNTLVEIIGNEGLVVFNDITNFSVTNAKVEMGLGSKLIVEASKLFSMNNTEVTAKNTSQKHGGVHVWGCGDNKFTGVDVKFGTIGFNNYPDRHNRNGGSNCRTKLKLNSVNISDCDIGIYSQGNELVFKNGSITSFGQIGWKATAQSTISLLNNINIESLAPNAQGIQRYGNGTVHIYNSKIHETKHGLYTEEGFIRPTCTEIYNNNGVGAWLEGDATLAMSNSSKTVFSNNSSQHILSRYNGVLQFSNGENGFINPSNQSSPGYWASLRPNQPFSTIVNTTQKSVDATNNFTPTWAAVNAPNGSGDYLHHDNVSSTSYYHYLAGANSGSNYSSSSTYLTYWNSQCPISTAVIPGDWSNWGEEINLNNQYGGSNGNSFYSVVTQTPTWGTSTLGDNYASIANLSSDTSADPKDILQKSIEILNVDFSSVSPIPEGLHASLIDLHSFASRAYFFAYSKYTVKPDSVDTTNLSAINSGFENLSSSLLSKANNNVVPWNQIYFKLYVNKSTVARLNRNHDAAIADLNNALSYLSDSNEIKYINRWICVNEQEKENRQDSIFSDSTADVFAPCYGNICQGDYNVGGSGNTPNNAVNIIGSLKNRNFKVYPNPTREIIWIEGIKNSSDLKVFNAEGKQMSVSFKKVSNEKYVLFTQNLSNGVYTLVFNNKSDEITKYKFVVLK